MRTAIKTNTSAEFYDPAIKSPAPESED